VILHIEADGTIKLPPNVMSALGVADVACEVHGGEVTLRPGVALSQDPEMVATMRAFDDAEVTEAEIAQAIADVRAARRGH